jgi:hypothetical protein
MFHMCALITIAMQLTCVVDKEIHCTDSAYLAQLLNVLSCERVFSHQDRADVSSANNASSRLSSLAADRHPARCLI